MKGISNTQTEQKQLGNGQIVSQEQGNDSISLCSTSQTTFINGLQMKACTRRQMCVCDHVATKSICSATVYQPDIFGNEGKHIYDESSKTVPMKWIDCHSSDSLMRSCIFYFQRILKVQLSVSPRLACHRNNNAPSKETSSHSAILTAKNDPRWTVQTYLRHVCTFFRLYKLEKTLAVGKAKKQRFSGKIIKPWNVWLTIRGRQASSLSFGGQMRIFSTACRSATPNILPNTVIHAERTYGHMTEQNTSSVSSFDDWLGLAPTQVLQYDWSKAIMCSTRNAHDKSSDKRVILHKMFPVLRHVSWPQWKARLVIVLDFVTSFM